MLASDKVQIADARIRVFSESLLLVRRKALPERLELHSSGLYHCDKVRASGLFTVPLMYQSDKALHNTRAMDIYEVRRENLREQARKLGGQARLASSLDKSESEVSQLIGRSPSRNIGAARARTFEKALGLRRGALDVYPDTGEFAQSAILREIGKILASKDDATQRDILEIVKRIK